jgi:hypothetical protein
MSVARPDVLGDCDVGDSDVGGCAVVVAVELLAVAGVGEALLALAVSRLPDVRLGAAFVAAALLLGFVLGFFVAAGVADGVLLGASASCGQIVVTAMSGGSRRPPSCQTQASVEPGAGSWVAAPRELYTQVLDPVARYQYDQYVVVLVLEHSGAWSIWQTRPGWRGTNA